MTRKNAFVIQHVPFEGLGHLAPVLETHGYRVVTYMPPIDEVWTIDPAHIDLLVILGGPMSVNDAGQLAYIADEVHLATTALAGSIPMLGICLGAQIMAVAAGGSVAPMPAKEIEMAPIRLTPAGQGSPLQPLSATQPVLHWHGEAITTLPPTAERLAETDACAVQAFSIGPRALGLQFHIETDLDRLAEWTHGHAAEVAGAGVDAEALEQAGRQHQRAMQDLCKRVMTQWLEGVHAAA